MRLLPFSMSINHLVDLETLDCLKKEKKETLVEFLSWLVGMARFELTTSCSQSRHSNRAELHPAHFLFESECKGTAFF